MVRVFFFLIMLLGIAHAQDKEPSTRDQAYGHMQEGDFPKAAKAFEALLAKDAKDVEAKVFVAYCTYQVGKTKRAREMAIAALAETKKPYLQAWAHVTIGECDASTGKVEAAHKAFLKAIELAPKMATPRAAVGDLLLQAGHLAQAAEAFDAALACDPDYGAALAGKARVLWKSGQARKAAELLTKALEKHPKDPYLRKERGIALYELRRYAEAAKDFRHALALRPNDPIAWIELGNALDLLQRFPAAEKAYARAIQLAPQQREAHLNLAVCLLGQGKLEAALREVVAEEAVGEVREPKVYQLKIHVLKKLERDDEVPAVEAALKALTERRSKLGQGR